MDIGVFIFPTEYSIRIDELARELEARRFESLFVPEHTHIPTSRRSPFAGGELPEEYKHTHDPFVALAYAAAVTTRLKIVPWCSISSAFQPPPMPSSKRPLDSRSRLATDLAVVMVSRSMIRQMPVPIFRRVVTAAA